MPAKTKRKAKKTKTGGARRAIKRPKRKPAAKKTARKKTTRARKVVKKVVRKKARPRKKAEKNLLGIVTHYFPHVNAAVLKLMMPLSLGELIKVKGHTTDFTQPVESIQIEHIQYPAAKRGDEVGLGVRQRVRRKDRVYKV